MKDHLTRQHLGAAAFVLAALLLAGTTVVMPNTTMDAATDPDGYGIDILALNPKHD